MADAAAATPQLGDYLAIAWRRRIIIVIVVVVAGVAAAAVSLIQTPMYRASTDVLLSAPPSLSSLTGAPIAGSGSGATGLANEQALARSSTVIQATKGEVGSSVELSVSAASAASVVTFTAVSDDPELAAVAADTYAETFIDLRQQSRLDQFTRTSGVLNNRINDVNQELTELRAAAVVPGSLEAARINALEDQRQTYLDLRDSLVVSGDLSAGAGAEVIQPATIPSGPFEPTTARNIAVALLVGLVLGVALAFVAENLDTTLRSDQDLQAATGVPSLAVVPDLETWKNTGEAYLVTRDKPRSPAAESYRGLRTSLQFMAIDRPLGVVQITSARPAEGKSTSAANLAVACARAGQRVILVDCDLRKPRLHSFFDMPPEAGFTSLLIGVASLDELIHQVADEPGLSVLTAGRIPPDPSELLSGARARQIFSELRNMADLVIVDTPPVLAVADPLIVSGLVDGVVMVASFGSTQRGAVTKAAEKLRQVDAPILGTVLNRFSPRRGGGGYGYGHGYGYGYGYGYGTYGQNPAEELATMRREDAPDAQRRLWVDGPDQS
jgi:polysaccharide biosynthesis transport protein